MARYSMVMALVLLLIALPLAPLAAQAACTLNTSFQAVRTQIPDVVGDCAEEEHLDQTSGLTVQQTTTGGLLMLRPSDGLTGFTDWMRTWLVGPGGLATRRNDEPPFGWEGQALAATKPATVAAPQQSGNTSPATEQGPSYPPCSESVALPGDIGITKPESGLSPQLAAFSGAWEGKWDFALASRLYIKLINPSQAQGIYAWGDHPQGFFKAGWQEAQYQVVDGKKLFNEYKALDKFGGVEMFHGLSMTWVMGDDLNAISGVREQQIGVQKYPPSTITMTRCSL